MGINVAKKILIKAKTEAKKRDKRRLKRQDKRLLKRQAKKSTGISTLESSNSK